MNASRIRIAYVHRDRIEDVDGWSAPDGWHIIACKHIGGNMFLITLTRSNENNETL